MLFDTRLRPELAARKPEPKDSDGLPAEHDPREHVFVVPRIHGVTPIEVGEEEQPGVAIASDGQMAVAVPVKLAQRYDHGDEEPPTLDLPGTLTPDALAHARKLPVAPKTATLDLLSTEAVAADGAAFPRLLPGVSADQATPDGIAGAFGAVGMSEAVDSLALDPFRLVALAKAMGIRPGEGVQLVFRGVSGPISVLPRIPTACFPGEALGLLVPISPEDETTSDSEKA